jgi:hypothetical protein
MRIVMREQISGTRNEQPWPPVGEEIDLPDDEAAELVERGVAEPAGKRKREASKT